MKISTYRSSKVRTKSFPIWTVYINIVRVAVSLGLVIKTTW